ncbi:Uncharacterised protein [Mycobacterium tuberculosis]|nr:Uncharacterised protein [Mycobacterium tuberculosis]CKW20801.1 Uncharacterised protein [Mycobacterium tuberculosis]CNL46540.1 Uncharacterised protein [Mycobacterium tuberculosis]CNL62280.1 Uncharacterised protein [Mycobacterium tuberculosis]CNL82503.1 Uncharacterised protein [Mycobacterium tuberculosis]
MIPELRSMSPSVWLSSGERFSVALMNSARSPSNRGGAAAFWSEVVVIRHTHLPVIVVPGCRWAAVLVPRNDRSGSSVPPFTGDQG